MRVLGILGLSFTKIMKVPSTFTHGQLSLCLLLSLIETVLQSDLRLCLINISFLRFLVMCLKRSLQILFSHLCKIFVSSIATSALSNLDAKERRIFATTYCSVIVSSHSFTWFTNQVILVVKSLMISFSSI